MFSRSIDFIPKIANIIISVKQSSSLILIIINIIKINIINYSNQYISIIYRPVEQCRHNNM